MYYESYAYHCANTEPVNRIDTTRIYGIELEIDDDSQTVREILDEAIVNDILTSPENEHRTSNLKCIEEDSSVYREIILNADVPAELLERLQCLNDWDINPDYINNTDGTSCHIHINREHLQEKGINTTNFYKTVEFYAPIIYAISGRTEYAWERWAEPVSRYQYTGAIDWKERGEHISYITPSSSRYHLVNNENSATMELRGFSNVEGFNYTTIKFYLEFVEFLISAAEYMRGKYFKDEGENLAVLLREWLNTNHPEQVQKYSLYTMLNNAPALQQFQRNRRKHQRIINELQYYKNLNYSGLGNWCRLLDWLEYTAPDHAGNLQRVTLTEKGFKNLIARILAKERQALQSVYNNYYMNHGAELEEAYK